MRLEFMQENSNQLQQSRWDFFYFYHLSCWEPLLQITDLVSKPFQGDPERFSNSVIQILSDTAARSL